MSTTDEYANANGNANEYASADEYTGTNGNADKHTCADWI